MLRAVGSEPATMNAVHGVVLGRWSIIRMFTWEVWSILKTIGIEQQRTYRIRAKEDHVSSPTDLDFFCITGC
jgi:hypothetical protein